MKHSAMRMGFDHGIARTVDARSLLVDSAISHCEKLRRVLELETWIRDAHDCQFLERASERWQAERDELIAELEISD